jgi:preprotein translocase subunit SecE
MAAPLNREQKRAQKGSDGGSSESGTTARRSRPSAKDAPSKKEERTSPRQFVKEMRAELRKVAWPTRQETLNYSLIVAATLVFMTLLIFGLDTLFSDLVLRLFDIKP